MTSKLEGANASESSHEEIYRATFARYKTSELEALGLSPLLRTASL